MLKTAVAYLRTSGIVNPKSSIPNQRENVQKYCREKNILLRKIFVDECKTGTKVEGRDGYIEMLETLEQESIPMVIVANFDRFSRQSFEFVKTVTQFKERGIAIVSVQQNQNTLEMNSVQIAMAGLMAEMDNQHRTERLYEGRMSVRRKGKFSKGSVPFGYQLDEERFLIIHKQDSIIVREIFETYVKDRSVSKVIKVLNERYRTINLNLSDQKVRTILMNPVYIGKDVKLKEQDGADAGEIQFEIVSMKEHKSIIREDLFLEVYSHLSAVATHNKTKPYKKNSSYLASNFISCLDCGKALRGQNLKYRCDCKQTFYDVDELHALWKQAIDTFIVSQLNAVDCIREKKAILSKKKQVESQFATCKISLETYETRMQRIQRELMELERNNHNESCLMLKRLKRIIEENKKREISNIIEEINVEFVINPILRSISLLQQ